MKRILVVVNNLFVGGITSYLISMTNYLVEKGNDVDIIYFRGSEDCLAKFDDRIHMYQYPKNSKVRVLASIFMSRDVFSFVRAVLKKERLKITQLYCFHDAIKSKHVEKKYDIAISSEEFFSNEYVWLHVNADKKIGWIHPDYRRISPIKSIDEKVFAALDQIALVSEQNLVTLQKEFPLYQDKFCYVPNIMDAARICELSREEIPEKLFDFSGIKLVTVCRFDNSSKRLDRIVHCCSYLKKKSVEFRWYIVGDGKDFPMIKRMVDENALEDVLILVGNRSNPYPYMKAADVFVLTSQYEGKSITVEEAKILKKPVVVTEYGASNEQVSVHFGKVIPNNDESIPNAIYEIITGTEIDDWKKEMETYEYSACEAYQAIDRLLDKNGVNQ